MKSPAKELQLLYHTASEIPPPLAFRAMIRLTKVTGPVSVEFNREYIGREEIPLQEIEAEGFSAEDDFQWSGSMPEFWYAELQKLAEESEWKEASETQVLFSADGGATWLSPLQEKKWATITEEIIQACLEEGGKELPMEMVYGELLKNNFYELVSLEWRFARKEIHIIAKGGNQAAFTGRDWEEAGEQLKAWMEEEASDKDLYQLPKFKGYYWLVNNEIWLPDQKIIRGRVWEWVQHHKPA
jgi:hypothetical protein